MASIEVRVLRFDIDPRIALILGNSTDLGNPVALASSWWWNALAEDSYNYYHSVIASVKRKMDSLKRHGSAEILSIGGKTVKGLEENKTEGKSKSFTTEAQSCTEAARRMRSEIRDWRYW